MKKQIALALAGGGLKSFCQIALLENLQQNNIEIKAVSGTSMGSVLAALVACGLQPNEIEKIVLDIEQQFKENNLFRFPSVKVLPFVKNRINGLVDHEKLVEVSEHLFNSLGFPTIESCPMPLCIPMVRVKDGKLILATNRKDVFPLFEADSEYLDTTNVSLGRIVAASCCFPFVFSTAIIKDETYMDGGVRLNCPIDTFNPKYFDGIIGATQMEKMAPSNDLSNFVSVGMYAMDIVMRQLEMHSIYKADLVFNVPVSAKLTFELGQGKDIIQQGRKQLQKHPLDYSKIKYKFFKKKL